MKWRRKRQRIQAPPSGLYEDSGRIGSMRIGEAIAPIESILLGRHALWVTARFPASDEGECGPVTLYTPEGDEFSSGREIALDRDHGRIRPGDDFTVTYRLNVDTINGVRLAQ